MIAVLRRYLPRIDRLGDDSRAVLIRQHYVFALIFNTRYREAAAIQQETSAIAERLGRQQIEGLFVGWRDMISTVVAPKPLHRVRNTQKTSNRGNFRDDGRVHSNLDQVCHRLGRDITRTHKRRRAICSANSCRLVAC